MLLHVAAVGTSVELTTRHKANSYYHQTKSLTHYTVFRQINAPGVEAENEPLTLSDLDENDGVYSQIPQN